MFSIGSCIPILGSTFWTGTSIWVLSFKVFITCSWGCVFSKAAILGASITGFESNTFVKSCAGVTFVVETKLFSLFCNCEFIVWLLKSKLYSIVPTSLLFSICCGTSIVLFAFSNISSTDGTITCDWLDVSGWTFSSSGSITDWGCSKTVFSIGSCIPILAFCITVTSSKLFTTVSWIWFSILGICNWLLSIVVSLDWLSSITGWDCSKTLFSIDSWAPISILGSTFCITGISTWLLLFKASTICSCDCSFGTSIAGTSNWIFSETVLWTSSVTSKLFSTLLFGITICWLANSSTVVVWTCCCPNWSILEFCVLTELFSKTGWIEGFGSITSCLSIIFVSV